MRVIPCHTRRSIAAYLFKPAGYLRRNCLAIFDPSARSVDRNMRALMAMDGGKSRISSRSVRERQRLKIGRCLAIGKALRRTFLLAHQSVVYLEAAMLRHSWQGIRVKKSTASYRWQPKLRYEPYPGQSSSTSAVELMSIGAWRARAGVFSKRNGVPNKGQTRPSRSVESTMMPWECIKGSIATSRTVRTGMADTPWLRR